MNRQFPFSNAAQASVKNKNRETRDRWITRAFSFSAIILSAVGVIVSLNATRTSVTQANRAWIGLVGMPVIDRLTMAPKWRVDYHYEVKNFGHGPALKVVDTTFVVTERGLAALDSTATFTCEAARHFSTGSRPRGGMPLPGPFGATLFPEQSVTEPLEPLNRFWEEDSVPDFFQLVGCVAYMDQFKQSHWTRFCILGRIEQGQLTRWNYCGLYNDTDEVATGPISAEFEPELRSHRQR
jgi:hypothetical protein